MVKTNQKISGEKCSCCKKSGGELVQTNMLVKGIKANTKILCAECTVLHWLVVHFIAKKKHPTIADAIEKKAMEIAGLSAPFNWG